MVKLNIKRHNIDIYIELEIQFRVTKVFDFILLSQQIICGAIAGDRLADHISE